MAKRPVAVLPQPAEPEKKSSFRVTFDTLSRFLTKRTRNSSPAATPWTIPKPPPGVLPSNAMAMDSGSMSDLYSYASSYGQSFYGLSGEGLEFLNYPVLSALAQRPEYRRLVGTRSQELTRKWGRLTSTGDADKSVKLKTIDEALVRYNVRDLFRKAADHDGFFGRAQIYVDVGTTKDTAELLTPLTMTPEKIGKGDLKRFHVVEPVWTYPGAYNTTDPLDPDFYRPVTWFVMGRAVHRSRLITMISCEIPEMMRPAYMFGGLSLIQMAKPFVDEWIRARKSVSDLIEAFTIFVLKTDMSAQQNGLGVGENLDNRMQLFNLVRDNRGVMAINKDTEELDNISAPLGGLDKLVAQCQERIAFPDGQPLVKLFGITPSGLNASSEGEMDAWRDRVVALQVHLFGAPMKTVLDAIQLSEFGEIDPAIGWEWSSLEETNEVEKSTIRKTEADTAAVLIDKGVISPEEERQRLARERGSLYANLDLTVDVSEPVDGTDDDQDGLPAADTLTELPKVGDRVEFLGDGQTEKGPSSGSVVSVKGTMVVVSHSDTVEPFDWADLDVKSVREDLEDNRVWTLA
jgi:phage-related protein (TIGR01555 family)